MVTSCFFCQNLLSDFVEGILPSARHEEIKRHIETCEECKAAQNDLRGTLRLLKAIIPRHLTSETSLRISEASQPGRVPRLNKAALSRWALVVVIPVMLFAGAATTFPDYFAWLPTWRGHKEEMQLNRYYPLQQGAAEILDEQGSWLHARETLMGSLWDEGGLSPEEFEKTFQVKSGRQKTNEVEK
jgi:predicted anti-sigma-YlaC factor YlaD